MVTLCQPSEGDIGAPADPRCPDLLSRDLSHAAIQWYSRGRKRGRDPASVLDCTGSERTQNPVGDTLRGFESLLRHRP